MVRASVSDARTTPGSRRRLSEMLAGRSARETGNQ